MSELYVVNNMMCCAPLRATLRTLNCAQRHRLANTQKVTMANGVEEHNELDGSPCRLCPTGAANEEALLPTTNRDRVRVRAGLDKRICKECKGEFQPTSRTHRWCLRCGKVRKRVLEKAAIARKKAQAGVFLAHDSD